METNRNKQPVELRKRQIVKQDLIEMEGTVTESLPNAISA